MKGQKFTFTQATLAEMKRLRDETGYTKKEVCDYLGTCINTVNRAADEAGLRSELTALFPPHSTLNRRNRGSCVYGMRKLKPEQIKAPLRVDLDLLHIQAAIRPWRLPA